jgi:hypothetical protein
MIISAETIRRHLWITGYAVLVTIGVTFRFFNSTVWGGFLLSVALYFAASSLGWSDPLSPGQLVAWFDSLNDTNKAVIMSSLLTIAGFLIAFQTATKNWKDQMAASAALEISREIEAFFRETSRLLTKAKTLVDYLLESEATVRDAEDSGEVDFRIGYILDQKTQFTETRTRLGEMSIQSHTKFSAQFAVLSSYWGVIPNLLASIQALTEIVDALWFTWPSVKPCDLAARERFLEQIEPEKCREFINIHNDNFETLNAMSSSASSRLAIAIIRPNLSFLVTFLYALKWAPIIMDARRRARPLFGKYVSGD